ncbi:NFACT family protein [Lactococcus cremoris]|jgi:predicted ribosome quality control (RQC) complex YloA/Tae2 family protein|uniref:Rqc2 homolog RqcH n=4 Tax=Lactococcus lactis subsp. cremoris TaxID=1359 RepID=A0A895IE49_LACLC|nr:NFACT RNA binding domain-containing protein [Lactococcus cremoris]EQC90020.1 dihydroorotate dehydrogenase [Lactococcus cremoris subsp. cremoris TIFN7]EQC95214.1 dihydroorotate dehydrogenase [Lactococcus cremoris subsp. cremoris TIFN3]MCI1841703.1 NFACT family protein [Lactococcus lactis]ABJ72960.1 Fibronectin-binding protein [Lactococcus cremoris subsp. cremoris SK11]AFW91844.1 Fibronectin-binding protein A [Lactococcus cremoris subsp. cremoris UC509.9]
MSFDGIFLHHMTAELQPLVGGRIQKINQPFDQELVLTIRSAGKSHKLLLSAHPVFGRVQLTKTDFQNPQNPNNFVMILRKYLAGAFLEKIEQVENDRQIIFHISTKDEIGDSLKIALIAEIMGKHSNIILLEKTSQKIIESIKHIGFSQNQYRTILPGSTYIAPPASNATDPFKATDEEIFDALQTEQLQQKFQGIGRDSKIALTGLSVKEFKEKLLTVKPSIYPTDNFSSIQLTDDFVSFDSLSEMLDVYYADKAERDRVKQVAASVIKKIQNELKKNRDKLKKQERELLATDNAEIFRQKGELLNTFLNQVPNDKTSVTLENYYTNEPLDIALNPALSPAQNAQRYFHRYQKLKQAVKFLGEQIAKTKETIHYLESVESNLENADVPEIADIREELIQTGYIKQKYRNKKQKMLPPEKYQAEDGTIILVGKNNLQNEQVSFKLSRRGDLWFHVKDIPGSHVLITGNPNPSDETITFAGELAAYFSKARYSNLVQVDVLDVKKLHKPTGTAPGFVTYDREKTIRVTPDEAVIKSRKISK